MERSKKAYLVVVFCCFVFLYLFSILAIIRSDTYVMSYMLVLFMITVSAVAWYRFRDEIEED